MSDYENWKGTLPNNRIPLPDEVWQACEAAMQKDYVLVLEKIAKLEERIKKSQEQEPVGWITPAAYGSNITFYQPYQGKKPEDWDDDFDWYCRPVYKESPNATTTKA